MAASGLSVKGSIGSEAGPSIISCNSQINSSLFPAVLGIAMDGPALLFIEHVNVVTIFQVGQVDRLAFMAMQWLPGQTLDSRLASEEPMDNEQIVEIVRQIAACLLYTSPSPRDRG